MSNEKKIIEGLAAMFVKDAREKFTTDGGDLDNSPRLRAMVAKAFRIAARNLANDTTSAGTMPMRASSSGS